MDETFAHLFDQTALRLNGKQAILFLRKGKLESQVTYSSLQQISNRVANTLIEMGLKKGERVILFMPKKYGTGDLSSCYSEGRCDLSDPQSRV